MGKFGIFEAKTSDKMRERVKTGADGMNLKDLRGLMGGFSAYSKREGVI